MLCGLPGAGKTTYSLALESAHYCRLSIDEQIWSSEGRYGLDYPPEQYAAASERADRLLRRRLRQVAAHRDVVVDYGFLSRRIRDEYKELIAAAGAAWALVYLQAEFDLLCRRLDKRRGRFDANAAFTIDAERLADYRARFEPPSGEGEIVVRQTSPDDVTFPDAGLLRRARC